jgi:large subunit ribosomal protein L22
MAEAAAEKKEEAAPKPRRFTARLRHARISARKMRYVVDLVRGKDYNSAIAILRACPKRGAGFCKKLLESAYENAMDNARSRNLDIDGNKLHLVEARVDPGPIIKRWRPSSVRRPVMIKKRLCHVVFGLEERELRESRRERTRRQKQERQKKQAAAKAAAAAVAKPAAPEGKEGKT